MFRVPLLDFALSVERIQSARSALVESGTGVVLTARSEGFVWDRPDIDETVRRLTAYAEAGVTDLRIEVSAPDVASREATRAALAGHLSA